MKYHSRNFEDLKTGDVFWSEYDDCGDMDVLKSIGGDGKIFWYDTGLVCLYPEAMKGREVWIPVKEWHDYPLSLLIAANVILVIALAMLIYFTMEWIYE